MSKKVLILGANGRFGRNAHAAFSWAGWDVICFDRDTGSLPDAAWGVDAIINAWNPAYTDWETMLPKLTAQIIETAQATGIPVLIPGNIYPYGSDMPETLSEKTGHRATNPLGRARIEMERAYRDANVRTIILRAGDFIDTEQSGNWYDQIITAKLRKNKLVYPGNPDITHAWAYLPDLADSAVQLIEQADHLDQFTDVLFPGFTLSGRDLQRIIGEILDRPVALKQMSWLPIQASKPFWPMAKSLLEMRYLWQTPHRISADKFDRLVPDFQVTPLYDAIASSLPENIHPNRPVPRPKTRFGFANRPFNCCGNNLESS